MAARYGEDFAGTTQAATLGETMRIGDAHRHLPARRPRPRLGADRGRGERPPHRRLRRLQAPRRPDLPALRAGRPATSSSPRRPSACRSSATRRPEAEIAQAPRLARPVPRARPSRRRLFARQGAARHPHAPRRRLRPHRSISTARWSGSAGSTRRRASRSAPLAPATVATGQKGDFAGAVIICPPSEIAERWARRFPDPVAALRLGLDAHPPARRSRPASNCRSSSPTTPTGTN